MGPATYRDRSKGTTALGRTWDRRTGDGSMVTGDASTGGGDRRRDQGLPFRSLKGSAFLGRLTEVHTSAVLRAGRVRRVGAHEVVTVEGQHDERCYLIVAGTVREHRTSLEGRELVQAVRGAGDLLNTQVAFGPRPAPMTVTALEPLTLLQIAGVDLRRLLQEHPVVLESYAEILEDRLLETWVEQAWLASDDCSLRITRRLLQLAELSGRETPEGIRITATLSQEELGSWAGASRESVAKLLQGLRGRDIVRTGHRHLVLCDPDALRRRLTEADSVELAGYPPRG